MKRDSPFSSSVFARFTLRSLAANRVRTAVTVVGIALATGLLMAVLASVTSLQAGLANQSRETDGVWQVKFPATDDAELQSLRDVAGDLLDRLATQRDLGSAAFSTSDAERNGTYLSVLGLPVEQGGTARAMGDDAYEVLLAPSVTSGRLPEKDGEIALTSNLRGIELTPGASELPGIDAGVAADGPLELDSQLTLSLGRRVQRYEDGSDDEVGAESGVMYRSDVYGTDADGTADVGQGQISETLEGVSAPRTYTVVGFVEPDWTIPGYIGYVSPDQTGGAALPRTNAYFSTSCSSREELDELVERLRPSGGDRASVLNGGLLTYQGLGGDRLIFDTLAMFAATLAVVIVVAAVSLISNAFTISVSERTRQFGLLSSLGASRRQLRRTVFVEAGVLGAVGIPLGVAIGIAGAAVAFAVTGEGWARMVGTDSAVTLVVSPWSVALTVLLASLTLVVSAMVPAVRASRVSAVDAIRQSADVRPSRRLRRVFARRTRPADDLSPDGSRPRGLAARLGGVPAFLARRTLLVSSSKARVAVLSLAVSVTLLVTAGVVNDMLTGATDATQLGSATSFDLELTVADHQDEPEEGDGADRGGSVSLAAADDLLARIGQLDGVEGAAYYGSLSAAIRLSGGLLGGATTAGGDLPASEVGNVDGQGYASADVFLVDDATWRSLAERGVLGADAADPSRLSALLVGTVYASDGSRYVQSELLPAQTTGEVDLLAIDERAGYEKPLLAWGEDGTVVYYAPEDGSSDLEVPLREAARVVTSVPVTVVGPDLGEDFPLSPGQLSSQFPTLVMPARAVRESGVALDPMVQSLYKPWVSVLARLEEGADDAEALRQMEGAAEQIGGIDVLGSTNLAATLRDARAMSFTVQVFLFCFAAILALIAVANVFNTIASGMMLRTREFAVLRSAGMGERSFRKMIFVECADYALKGLVLGGALALIVEWFLWQAMSLSVSGVALVVPWGHLALAFALVVGVLAASVLYALRKTHAMNLVEALRADAL